MSTPLEIAEALGLTQEDLDQMEAEKLAFEQGKPVRAAEIIEASERIREANAHDPYYRPPKTERVKKPLDSSKRDWTERQFQSAFSTWATVNGSSSACFELKSTPGTSLPFSSLEPHQRDNLLKAKHGRLYHRLSDLGNFSGIHQKQPFDCFMLSGVKAFVVPMYNVKERGNKVFYLIDIDAWCEEEKKSDRKSLTEERAGQIGKKCSL
jgi:hypothetical protein